jgi:hypothetical protein
MTPVTSKSDIIRTYIVWSQSGKIVSSADLAEHHGQSLKSVHEFMHAPKVVKYLATRHNLAPPPLTLSRRTLSDEQRAWLTICTNPYANMSIQTMVKLTDWMTMSKHRAWMKQQAFLAEYQRLMALEIRGSEGEIVRRTANKAVSGDTKAIEMLARLKGEPLPQAVSVSEGGGIQLDVIMSALQQVLDGDQLAEVAHLLLHPEDKPKAIEQKATAQILTELEEESA